MAKKTSQKATTAKAGKTDNKSKTSKYSKHAESDSALAANVDYDGNDSVKQEQMQGLTLIGKIIIFLLFPSLVGFLGLYTGYLAKKNDPNKELSFDTDFALPFTLALTLSVVVGFQTGGFTTRTPKTLVRWPKVKKRRVVVHKHVVKSKAGNNEEDKVVEHKDEQFKKNN